MKILSTLALCFLWFHPVYAKAPINWQQPTQITHETQAVFDAQVDHTGQRVAFVVKRNNNVELWLKSTPSASAFSPQLLWENTADILSPQFSKEGDYLSFVSTEHDVKGDLYILSLTTGEGKRLTGREAADGAPSFGPDGRLYFHRRLPGDASYKLAFIDLKSIKKHPKVVDLKEKGMMPSLHPQERQLLFVQAGNLFWKDLRSDELKQLTSGLMIDLNPTWSADGSAIYFSRIEMDTNKNKRFDYNDRAVIHRLSWPVVGDSLVLTNPSYSALNPHHRNNQLFYLSDGGGKSELWQLPEQGYFPVWVDQNQAQQSLLKMDAYQDPYMAILLLEKAVDQFSDNADFKAELLWRLANRYRLLGHTQSALSRWQRCRLPNTKNVWIQLCHIDEMVAQSRKISANANDSNLVAAYRLLAQIRLLLTTRGDDQQNLSKFQRLDEKLDHLDKSLPLVQDIKTESDYLKARLYRRLHIDVEAENALVALIKDNPANHLWQTKALNELLNLKLSQAAHQGETEDWRVLRRVAEKNRSHLPQLAMAALNRQADLWYQQKERQKAKVLYQEVLDFPQQNSLQVAAAQLALAEIYYEEAYYRKAITLYEKALKSRPEANRLYRLVYKAYVRKSLAAGETLYRNGEMAAATKVFKELLQFDQQIVEAHRGYIKSLAAQGRAREALTEYQKKNDALSIYSTGLVLTYLDDPDALPKARVLLQQAIEQNNRIEYFYQTLGYVHENIGDLDAAQSAYQIAYSLNNPEENPENTANLLINLGNIDFLQQRFTSAYPFYQQRLDMNFPFDHEDTELIFYQRLGISAFHREQGEAAILAFQKALTLVDRQSNPKSASAAFDKLSQFLFSDLLKPAIKNHHPQGLALAESQSALNQQVFALNRLVIPQAYGAVWDEYLQKMNEVIAQQEQLNQAMIGLSHNVLLVNQVNLLTQKLKKALKTPERLSRLQTELLDRLALSYQESGRWEAAIKNYKQAFTLNKAWGRLANLSKNQRNIAHCTFEWANELSGEQNKHYLEQAAQSFLKTLTLIDQHGVANPKKENSGALIDIHQELSLQATTGTQAAFGFSAEQEKTLVRNFLIRIYTALKQWDQAETVLQQQLPHDGNLNRLATGEIPSVSALLHQSGMVTFARQQWSDSLNYFFQGARLTLSIDDFVGTVAHLRNALAALNQRFNPADYEIWQSLDEKLWLLLRTKPQKVTLTQAILDYHNTAGVYLTNWFLSENNETIEKSVRQSLALQNAVRHFSAGLKWIEAQDRDSRDLLARHANLLLNQSRLSGDQSLLKKALVIAQQAHRPDLQWRILAELGQFEKALTIINHLPLFSWGATPGEMIQSFAPWIQQKVQADNIEEAFELVEKLSEFERVFRLTSVILKGLSPQEKHLLDQNYARLTHLTLLQSKQIADKNRVLLDTKIKTIQQILSRQWGKKWEKLPTITRLTDQSQERRDLAKLLGLALQGERLMDALVNQGGASNHPALAQQLTDSLRNQQNLLTALLQHQMENNVRGLWGLFAAVPVTVDELLDILPEEAELFRQLVLSENQVLTFKINIDEMTAEIKAGAAISWPESPELIIAREDITQLNVDDKPQDLLLSGALSATHWFRTTSQPRPFKRKTLSWSATHSGDLFKQWNASHTLSFNQPVLKQAIIATRTGEHTFYETQLHHAALLSALPQPAEALSLAIFPDIKTDSVYATVHLLSLMGVPSVLVKTEKGKANDLQNFLADYQKMSTVEALKQPGWWLLGSRGMDPAEAQDYSRKKFAHWVKQGQKAYQDGHFQQAMSLFGKAILVAQEFSQFNAYLAQLYPLHRDSAYQMGNLETALQSAQNLSDWYETNQPDTQRHAKSLLNLGALQSQQQQSAKAIETLEYAVEIVENLELADETINALEDLGIVLENSRHYDQALMRFQSAAKLSQTSEKTSVLAQQNEHLGRLYDLRLSQYAKAKHYYQKALTLYEQPQKKTENWINIGRCERLLGFFSEAESAYDKALLLAKQSNNKVLVAQVRIEQANNAWFQGDYQQAFETLRQAEKIALTANDWPLGQVLVANTQGLIWWTLGDYDKALRALNAGLTQAKSIPDREDEVATTLNNIGIVYRERGWYEQALVKFKEALILDQALQSRWAIAYDLRNQAQTHLKMGQIKAAIPLFKQALTETQAIGNRINEAKSWLGLAEAYALTSPEKSPEAYNQALALAEALSLKEVSWRSLYGLGLQFELNQDQQKARQYYEKAVAVIEGMRANLKIDQLKEGFIGNKLAVYERLIALLLNMGKNALAFDVAERSRSRNFIDLLGNQKMDLGDPVEQKQYQTILKLRKQIDSYEKLKAGTADKKEQEIYAVALRKLQDEQDNLLIDIRLKNPQLDSLISIAPLKTAQVQQLLEPGVALLAYYLLPNEVIGWWLTKDDIKVQRTTVNRDLLEQQIMEYRRKLQNLEPVDTASVALYDRLLSPFDKNRQQAQVLGIIPHGILHYLAFSTLKQGESTLIDQLPLFFVPSASVMSYTLSRRQTEKNLKVLALGNPDLNNPDLALPFAEQEVSTIHWQFPQTTELTGKKAKEAWLKKHIGEFGIIHIASHGEFNPINPLASALLLSPDQKEDGFLKAQEIFGLNITADLVMLSACQTGLGKISKGDDVVGLNRSFFYAGTHSIISSLWKVSDISTAIMTKQFYRAYRGGENKSQALRRAMLHVKSRFPHPGYWGAFTLTGDYQ
jgi:CHAT domain-containing protein/tetratricopeptide (TPR) repeat protein